MLKSMTGFGDSIYETDNMSFMVEIKTVNNRYLKVSIKLPDIFSFAEAELEKIVKSKVCRGSVYCNIYVKDSGTVSVSEVNHAAALHYLNNMLEIARTANMDNPNPDLSRLMMLPGVCQPKVYSEGENKQFMDILAAQVEKSLNKLNEMRDHEGQALLEDLRKNCNVIKVTLDKLEGMTGEVVNRYRDKLENRVNELLASAKLKVDEDTLLREVAVFADKCDINEEISRLNAHLVQFDKICTDEEQVGRRLDFLTQEMLREANTIASKANNAQISQLVVDIKVAIDRLREQVQNVE